MPGVSENRERWETHKWAQEGDEWSPGRTGAGTALLWHRTILPRIYRFVPADTILEIGPGFGRWTQYLHQLCKRLIVVDLTPRCIQHCRERFAGVRHIEYHVNDGASLNMVADGRVDFIFSFDSLVHAEADAIGTYLRQAARTLRPGGAGFIHHSNLEAFVARRSGRLLPFVTATHWRAESMSAAVFRRQCLDAGLTCRSQELINWIGREWKADRHRLDGRSIPLTDCLSVFAAGCDRPAEPILFSNHHFVDEWRQTATIAQVYITGDVTGLHEPIYLPRTIARKLTTARTIVRRDGAATLVGIASGKLAAAGAHALSAIKARFTGMMCRMLTPRRFS